MTVKTIDVVCAFIVREPKGGARVDGEELQILCSQRYEDAEHFPSMYEFPGGKVDPGESHVEALRRECQEELNVEVEIIRDKGDKADEAIKPCYTFDHAPKARQANRRNGRISLVILLGKAVDHGKGPYGAAAKSFGKPARCMASAK